MVCLKIEHIGNFVNIKIMQKSSICKSEAVLLQYNGIQFERQTIQALNRLVFQKQSDLGFHCLQPDCPLRYTYDQHTNLHTKIIISILQALVEICEALPSLALFTVHLRALVAQSYIETEQLTANNGCSVGITTTGVALDTCLHGWNHPKNDT